MIGTRVIPQLLLRNRGLYKGTKFRNHRYVGDPINVIKIFNEKEVDELCLLDIDATNAGYEPDFDMLQRVAAEAFMPMAYGGGIRTLDHVQRVFATGFEKVVINTMAIQEPSLLDRAAALHGSQSIVVSIDVKASLFGQPRVVTHSARRTVRSLSIKDAVHLAVDHGAGEILVTSVDREGTQSGYDLNLIQMVASEVDVPVIASGGARTVADLRAARLTGAAAAGAGAMFVYQGPHRAVLISYPTSEEIRSL